jgi:hypothetical protein
MNWTLVTAGVAGWLAGCALVLAFMKGATDCDDNEDE